MSTKQESAEICEACGCAGEMGFIIKEGDDIAEVTIHAENKAMLEAELEKYINLAYQVSKGVQYHVATLAKDSTYLNAKFKFSVSAEKLIFELKTRSLAR
ncbi:YfcZ/YiiS family protein [Vibrio hepatarius]|uniref:YfcZ/YiiS family protein n=1 Tax=Vibrio hepatarius TaxID=171383 RepID=UPI001C08BC42|nr:YfcZ/YiiS family protein [Vibrio hepatarius]MBU2899058.1 YfcZ/YiiS family protein [Vibrio hepatarius]